MTSFLTAIPRYRCHKEVSALKIRAVIENPRGVELHFEDERFAPHQVSTDWLEKHDARAGGYLVVYEDGYQSWSPAAAFESGYTLIKEDPPCRGANCGATDGVSHSSECNAEHEAAILHGGVE